MGNCRSRRNSVNYVNTNNIEQDKYKIEKIINRGTFCNTYLVKMKNEYYVIKKYRRLNDHVILNNNLQFSLDIVNNEIEILSNIHHPCILKLHEYIETPKSISIITPYINGETIRSFIPKVIVEKSLKWIIYQILSVLKYLGEKCIIHRDIKPDNIIIDENYKITIIDFNCSHYIHQNTDIEFGTYGYKAPEIHYNIKYSFNSDIYSMGAVMYYMLYRMAPVDKHYYNLPYIEWPQIQYDKTVYSNNCINFLKNCLIFNKEKRYTLRECYYHRWIFDYIILLSESSLYSVNI